MVGGAVGKGPGEIGRLQIQRRQLIDSQELGLML